MPDSKATGRTAQAAVAGELTSLAQKFGGDHLAQQAAIQRGLMAGQGARPKNTTKTYKNAQKLWGDWCVEHGFSDADHVSEGKLVMFLEEIVFTRTVKARSRTGWQPKKKKARRGRKSLSIPVAAQVEAEADEVAFAIEEVDQEVEQRVGLKANSIDSGWISPILDLYKHQISLKLHNNTHPRGSAVAGLLEQRKKLHDQLRREAFEDRAVGTVLDGYTPSQFQEACELSLARQDGEEQWLRTRLDFLIGHYYCTRSEDRRNIEMCDMFVLMLDNEGPQACPVMVATFSQGKTNKHGHLAQMGAMRSKQVSTCVLGAMAQYLFYLWEILHEPFLSFNKRADWYNKKLIRGGKTPYEPISYETMLEWGHRIHHLVGIVGNSVLHMPRKKVVQLAELCGVSEEQLRRAGRWNNSSMARNYLSFLPQKFMRVIAGFYKDGGQFFLQRGGVPVPESLQKMVWKDLEDWKQRFRKHSEGTAFSYQMGGIDELDMAAQGFVELLIQLRIIFLQDAALLINKYPKHTMWTHAVFHHPEWAPFASQVQLAENNLEEPMDVQLKKVVPVIAEKITASQNYTGGRIEHLGNVTAGQFDKLFNGLSTLTEKVVDFTEGRIPFYISPNRPNPPASSTSEASAAPVPFSLAPRSRPRPDIATVPSSDGPIYIMCPKVATLPRLWREWHEGLANKPSVQFLEDKYGPKWRSPLTNAQKMWYSRRSFLIQEIKRRAADGDEEGSMKELEAFRLDRKMSLNALHDHLRGASMGTKRKR